MFVLAEQTSPNIGFSMGGGAERGGLTDIRGYYC